MLRPRLGHSMARRFLSSTVAIRQQDASKPPQPPKSIDDSTSALDYKRSHRIRPPPLPVTDTPRARTAEEAVTNILYNTPPPSLQPYKKYGNEIFGFFDVQFLTRICAPSLLDTFSIVSCKMSLVSFRVYQVFSQEEGSTSIP